MTRRRTVIALVALIVLSSPRFTQTGWSQTAEQESLRDALAKIITTQAQAWNEGNLEGFMEHYWKSEQLSFCAGGNRNFGWQAVYEGYKRRYPTPEKMGRLKFSNLDVRSLGDNAALVLGDWQLDRKDDQPGGNFSLVFQRLDGKWVITHDHTSSRKDD